MALEGNSISVRIKDPKNCHSYPNNQREAAAFINRIKYKKNKRF